MKEVVSADDDDYSSSSSHIRRNMTIPLNQGLII